MSERGVREDDKGREGRKEGVRGRGREGEAGRKTRERKVR